MAAPTLRHYVAARTTAGTDVLLTVPVGRSLVISKILVATNTSTTFTISTGGSIASGVVLSASGIYTENGLVLLAGETCSVQITSIGTGTVYSHVFGEEVDN